MSSNLELNIDFLPSHFMMTNDPVNIDNLFSDMFNGKDSG